MSGLSDDRRLSPTHRAGFAGWQDDGHPHKRDESGFCTTCGAVKGEAHYRCVPPGDLSDGGPPLESPGLVHPMPAPTNDDIFDTQQIAVAFHIWRSAAVVAEAFMAGGPVNDPRLREALEKLSTELTRGQYQPKQADVPVPHVAESKIVHLSPDCRDGNHQKCDGVAWDLVADLPTACGCKCGYPAPERSDLTKQKPENQ